MAMFQVALSVRNFMWEMQRNTVNTLAKKKLFDNDFPVATDDELLDQARMYLQAQSIGQATTNFRDDYMAMV